MKRLLLILMLVSICFYVAYAQEKVEKKIIFEKNSTGLTEDNVKLIMDNAGNMDPKVKKNIQITMTNDSDEEDGGAFIGIFTDDMTLDQAYQKGYRELFGILITGISQGSPAQKYKLMVDDILMKIDANNIANKDQLLKILQSYAPGDTAHFTIFRNKEQLVIPFVLGSKSKPVENVPGTISITTKKKSHSVGYGGGSWTPVWFMLNTDDVNYALKHVKNNMGSDFKEISNKGLFLNGGAGKGNVGKGFFIGGMGAGYQLKRNYLDVDDSTHKMRYAVSFGGVTLDKRFHIAKHITGSIGFLLGGGEQSLVITEERSVSPTGGYHWDDISSVNLVKNEVNMKRGYIVFQPKTELIYNLLSWLAIRGEVGYMMGYSSQDGWIVTNNHDAQVKNSPNTSFDNLTFSIGPWFGF